MVLSDLTKKRFDRFFFRDVNEVVNISFQLPIDFAAAATNHLVAAMNIVFRKKSSDSLAGASNQSDGGVQLNPALQSSVRHIWPGSQSFYKGYLFETALSHQPD